MWLIIFFVITLLLLLLPMLPSLMELIAPTDVQPLKVVQEYDTDIRYFAHGLRAYLHKNFQAVFADDADNVLPQSGTLQDDAHFQVVTSQEDMQFSEKESRRQATTKLIVSTSSLVLPRHMFFKTEVYSKKSIQTQGYNHFRALLAEEDIDLGAHSVIFRWVHSHTSLRVEPYCKLFGRASADEKLSLAAGVIFNRLHSAEIVFGQQVVPSAAPDKAHLSHITKLSHVRDRYKRRWIVNGHLEIPAHSFFDGNLVATGSISIGEGSYIAGSIKSNGALRIAPGVHIAGSAVSTKDLYIGSSCHLYGPIIAEQAIHIATNSVIGSKGILTTVSAPDIHITGDVAVFGTVWAEKHGTVT